MTHILCVAACPGVVRLPHDLFYILFLDVIKSNLSLLDRICKRASPRGYIKGSLVFNIPESWGRKEGRLPVA